VETLQRAQEDDFLLALGNYLFGAPGGGPPPPERESPWKANHFRLFLSHISAQKQFVSAVKSSLATRGIDGFVAHEDIEPTKEWLDQIEIALETCDALAAILTNGFHESQWTDQEVGFCVNRRVLVIPVRLGVDPYGFVSRYQAFTPLPADSGAVASGLFDILCKHDLTAEKMGPALVSLFADSCTFADAKQKVKLLERVRRWTPEMLREIEQAVEKNSQIRDSFGVPEAVRGIVRAHGK
jgi:TIR domain